MISTRSTAVLLAAASLAAAPQRASAVVIDLNTPANEDWAVQYVATTSVPEASSMGMLVPMGSLLGRRRRA